MAKKFERKKKSMGAILGCGKWKWKSSLRNEYCLEAVGKRLENVEDKEWEQMDADVVSSLHLAITDNILSSISELQSTKDLGYFDKLIWGQVVA